MSGFKQAGDLAPRLKEDESFSDTTIRKGNPSYVKHEEYAPPKKETLCPNCGNQLNTHSKFCGKCGTPVRTGASTTPGNGFSSGTPVNSSPNKPFWKPVVSDKSRVVAALLCFFLGLLGIHRFYVGKVGTGILYLVGSIVSAVLYVFWIGLITEVIIGIAAIVDFVLILCGVFKDSYGLPLKSWK